MKKFCIGIGHWLQGYWVPRRPVGEPFKLNEVERFVSYTAIEEAVKLKLDLLKLMYDEETERLSYVTTRGSIALAISGAIATAFISKIGTHLPVIIPWLCGIGCAITGASFALAALTAREYPVFGLPENFDSVAPKQLPEHREEFFRLIITAEQYARVTGGMHKLTSSRLDQLDVAFRWVKTALVALLVASVLMVLWPARPMSDETSSTTQSNNSSTTASSAEGQTPTGTVAIPGSAGASGGSWSTRLEIGGTDGARDTISSPVEANVIPTSDGTTGGSISTKGQESIPAPEPQPNRGD